MNSKIGAGVKCQNKGIHPEEEERRDFLGWDWILWQNKDVRPAFHGNVVVTLNPALSTLGLEPVLGSSL